MAVCFAWKAQFKPQKTSYEGAKKGYRPEKVSRTYRSG